MENFEERALDLAPHKPLFWFRYVDDTFVIWPHGPDKLKDFLNHLNSIAGPWAIKFTVNLPISTSSLTLGPTTILPTSKLYSPHWCTGLELHATKTAYMRSWCS
jgi:hypothetical protein